MSLNSDPENQDDKVPERMQGICNLYQTGKKHRHLVWAYNDNVLVTWQHLFYVGSTYRLE